MTMHTGIDHEKIFFNYILSRADLLKKLKVGFFANKDLDQTAKLAKAFYLKFGNAPTSEQLIAVSKQYDEDTNVDIINSIYDVNLNQYDSDWLKRTCEAWIKWKHFDKQLVKTIEYVKTQDVSPENVESVVNSAISMLAMDGSISFDHDYGLDFFNPEHHIQRRSSKIETGWNFIDGISGGGYDPKTLIVYAGEANIGKSIWLANDAANFIRMGHNVVFISAEMSAQKVLKRIGANLLDITMSEYEEKSANRDFMKRKLDRVAKGLLPPGKLFIKEVPTSNYSVPDIESYIKDLEEQENVKINAIVVDYINILANYRNPNTENTYIKIKQIAEDLRGLCVKRNMLCVSATQIGKAAWDSSEVKMENIAESAGLAHTADVVYAIIQDSMMHANREYWLKVLKLRDGQGKGSRCRFLIDYEHMRLTETQDIS